MDSSRRRRWAVLSTALALTVAAIFLSPAPAEVVEANTKRARIPASAPAQQSVAIAPTFEEEASADPFEKRGWAEPPPPPAPVVPPAPIERTVAPIVVEPSGPPPLPYRYVGRFSDDSGAVVYLARGDVGLVARVGETLDGAYKVASLQARSVEFEHISTGVKQSLPIPDAE